MMKDYKKPMIQFASGYSESVYLSSGEQPQTASAGGCDSVYMKGVFHPGNPNGTTYMEKFGCQTCPKGNHNRCKLDGESAPNLNRGSGKNRPHWEMQGHEPDEVTHGNVM